MRIALILAASVTLTPAVMAQTRSELSRIEACEELRPSNNGPGSLLECDSHAGYRVRLLAGEHSASVAFGDNGMDYQLTHGPGVGGNYIDIGPAIEWRYREDQDYPFANIVRWRGLNPGYEGDTPETSFPEQVVDNVLVVSSLYNEGGVSACPVAYVDAAEIPGANEVAHAVADRYVPGFECGVSEVMVIDLASAQQLSLVD